MIFFIIFLLTGIPLPTLAQVQPPSNFSELVKIITELIGLLVVIIFVLTMLAFFWGLIKNFILKGAEPENLRAGKNVLLWGIIALVVMTALWGVLKLLQVTFFGA